MASNPKIDLQNHQHIDLQRKINNYIQKFKFPNYFDELLLECVEYCGYGSWKNISNRLLKNYRDTICKVASAAKINLFHQNRQQATQLLKSRVKRANSFMEEQTNRSNKERECIEEICDAEELTEYLENLPAYSNMRRAQIKLEAKNQLGTMKRMRDVAQHKKESNCPNFGYQVAIDDVNFNQDDPRVLKKAFDYDEDGYCSKPLDICQIYLDNNNARCGGKNQWCHNLNVENNNVTRGWDFYVENGLDYLGFECMCETGYRMHEGHCIKKASPCSFNPCKNQPNTKCEDNSNLKLNNVDLANAGFYCVCNPGFERINSSAKCESVCKDGFDWNNDYGVCVQGDDDNEYDSYGQQEIENIFN